MREMFVQNKKLLGVGTTTSLLMLSLLACSAAKKGTLECPQLEGTGEWALRMVAPNAEYLVEGQVQFAAGHAFTELVATTADGARELIEYPVQDLETRADSVSFAFAPIGYRLHGRCLSQDSIQGTFRVPQPPFGEIVGTWTMQRT